MNESVLLRESYAERFRADQLLKEGQGIATLLGVDSVTGQRVVIKRVASEVLSLTADHRLEHEAKVLHALTSPFLLPLLASGRQGKSFFLVTPHFAGRTLGQRVAARPLDFREAIRVFRCILSALETAHEHDILHGDVKPDNVLVRVEDPVDSAVLIDFGLSRSARLDASVRAQHAGTARYISPEQAGLIGRSVDQRSDLYSVGVSLFESLAGRPPFEGKTVGEVLREHLQAEARSLRATGVHVPTALDEITQRLLRKDPRDRYQSAAAVIADLDELEKRLAAGEPDPTFTIGLRDRRPKLTEPAFVGRRKELDDIDYHLEGLGAGKGGLVYVEAESGSGKSRLIEEIVSRCAMRGFWVLRGQCEDQVAPRPLTAFDGVARELVRLAQSDPTFHAELTGGLGEERAAIVGALPLLSEIFGQAVETDNSAATQDFGEARTTLAIVRLLDLLGTKVRRAVFVLDDVQWADELSIKIIEQWSRENARALEGDASYVTFLLSFRSDEVTATHTLRRLTPSTHLRLEPLRGAELRQLVESMAGALPAEATEYVGRLSEGNPFLAMAVLQGLVESQGLVSDEHGWHLVPEVVQHHAQSSRRAAAVLLRLVERLDPKGRRLLSVGALLGKEFEIDLAATLGGISAAEVGPLIEDARRRHLVWVDAQARNCAFVHDKIREAALEELDAQQRTKLHLAAAQRIHAVDPSRVFELSHHYEAAGALREAVPFALRAGELATKRYAFETAEHHYRIAERATSEEDVDIRLKIHEVLGEVLRQRGRYEEARRHLGIARGMVGRRGPRARIDCLLGEVYVKEGDTRGACEAMAGSLRSLGIRVPNRLGVFALFSLFEIFVQVLQTFFPMAFVRKKPLEGEAAVDEELLIRVYGSLQIAYYFYRGPLGCLWAQMSLLNLVGRHPLESPTRIIPFAAHSIVLALHAAPGLQKRSARLGLRAVELARTRGAPWQLCAALVWNGNAVRVRGEFDQALAYVTEGARVAARAGDHWNMNFAETEIAFVHYQRGDLPKAAAVATRLLETSKDVQDSHHCSIALEILAKCTDGHFPDVPSEWMKRNFSSKQSVAQADGIKALARGEPELAVKKLLEARAIQKEGYLGDGAVHVDLRIWIGRAKRELAEHTPAVAGEVRARRIADAYAAVKVGLAAVKAFPTFRAFAHREMGMVEAMRGRTKAAKRHFAQSLAFAERYGQRYELLLTKRVVAELGATAGDKAQSAELERIRRDLRALLPAMAETSRTIAPTSSAVTASGSTDLSVADRLNALLEEGRKIATSLTREAIFGAVREASRTLLHGETCFLLELMSPPAERPRRLVRRWGRGEAATTNTEYSLTLVDAAVEAGKPVTVGEGDLAARSTDSMVLSDARSALCAPIFVRRRIMGFIYVTHRQVGDLFGDQEVRVAAFLSAITGAALESADSMKNVDKRVEERTTSLAKEMAEVEGRLRDAQRREDDLRRRERGIALGDGMRALALRLSSDTASMSREAAELAMSHPDAAHQKLRRDLRRWEDILRRAADAAQPFECADTGVPARELVKRVVDDARAAALASGVVIALDESCELLVRGRGQELQRALAAIVENALDAAPRGSTVKVNVQAVTNSALGTRAVDVVVADQGAGIAEDTLTRVFDPFFTTKGEGRCGLGLTLARRVVESQGGAISVANGKGTTITVSLPIATLGIDDEATQQRPSGRSLVPDDATERMSVPIKGS